MNLWGLVLIVVPILVICSSQTRLGVFYPQPFKKKRAMSKNGNR